MVTLLHPSVSGGCVCHVNMEQHEGLDPDFDFKARSAIHLFAACRLEIAEARLGQVSHKWRLEAAVASK